MQGSQTRSRLPVDAPDGGLSERHAGLGLVAGAAAATALVIILLNNLLTGAPTQGIPVPDDTALPFPTETSGVTVRVPSLVGQKEPSATRALVARGLAPDVLHRFVACNPAGYVVDQVPGPGASVPAEGAVRLVVTDPTSEQLTCPEGVALDRDRALVDLVEAFGRGVAGARPPTAPTLRIGLLGAEPVVHLAGRTGQEVDRWRVPGGDPAAVRPVLAELVLSGGAYRVDLGPHPRCVGPDRAPAPVFVGLRQVAVTPLDPPESCLDWWAVDLFVDETGRIHGVNLDLGVP